MNPHIPNQPNHLAGPMPGSSPQQGRPFTDPFPADRPTGLARLLGTARRTRILRNEGPRGAVTRSAIWIRYVGYFLVIAVCSALTHGFLVSAQTTQLGGKFMLFVATLMSATCAIGSAVYPNHRDEIIEELRHYVFGLCLYPGTGIAAMIWAMQSMLDNPNANDDTMMQLLSFSVPVVFVCTLIIPPALYIKQVAGAQTMHRSTLDDEEMVAMYTRQDGYQR